MAQISATIPPISKDFLERLQKVFTPLQPQPNITTMDEIMFNAGQLEVIRWIEAHGHTETFVTGKADVTRTVSMR